VRSFEKRADRAWDDRYGRSIRIKTNVAEVLRRELGRRSWTHETVVIGAATDPYQPCEGRYKLTRACIEALLEARNPFGLITRGPMVVRDRDLLARAAALVEVRVNVSIPTLDERIWLATEPATAHPRQRLRAVRMLAEAGIRVSVLMGPVIPHLTDDDVGLMRVVTAAREAGAASVSPILLHLEPGTREHFLAELTKVWPDVAERIRQRYGSRVYAAEHDRKQLSQRVAAMRGRAPAAQGLPPLIEPGPQPEPPRLAEQLGLAL
jgi:DNA repair photolyase